MPADCQSLAQRINPSKSKEASGSVLQLDGGGETVAAHVAVRRAPCCRLVRPADP